MREMTWRAICAGPWMEMLFEAGYRQGLTLVHFSSQPEPFLTQNTP